MLYKDAVCAVRAQTVESHGGFMQIYVVQPGDTVDIIADQTGVSA